MEGLTDNQKDALFKISNFIKGFVLSDNLLKHSNLGDIRVFVGDLIREDVVDENEEMELIRNIHSIILIIGGND